MLELNLTAFRIQKQEVKRREERQVTSKFLLLMMLGTLVYLT